MVVLSDAITLAHMVFYKLYDSPVLSSALDFSLLENGQHELIHVLLALLCP